MSSLVISCLKNTSLHIRRLFYYPSLTFTTHPYLQPIAITSYHLTLTTHLLPILHNHNHYHLPLNSYPIPIPSYHLPHTSPPPPSPPTLPGVQLSSFLGWPRPSRTCSYFNACLVSGELYKQCIILKGFRNKVLVRSVPKNK